MLLRDAFGNPLDTPLEPRTLPDGTENMPIMYVHSDPVRLMNTRNMDTIPCKFYKGGSKTRPYISTGDAANWRGVYECSLYPRIAGPSRYLSVEVNGVPISRLESEPPLNNTRLVSAPWPISILPGTVLARESVFWNLPTSYVVGEGTDVLLQFRDSFGNDLVGSPDLIDFQAKMAGDNLPYVDNMNGTFTVTVRTTSASVNAEVEAKVVGEHVKGSPIGGLFVAAGLPSALGSSCTVPPGFPVGVISEIQCDVNDQFNNMLDPRELGYLVFIRAELQGPTQVADSGYGIYNPVTKKFHMKMTLTELGEFSVIVMLLAPGGVIAQYYRAPGFESMVSNFVDYRHRGDVVIDYTKIDHAIDFVWPDRPLDGMSADHFSIKWYGYLLPKVSGPHTFRIESDYAVALYINGKLILDRWDSKEPVSEQATVRGSGEDLTMDLPVELELRYQHATGTAYVRLFWQTDFFPEEIVPRMNLYNPLNVFSQDTLTESVAADASIRSLVCKSITLGGPPDFPCAVEVTEAQSGASNTYYLHTKDSYGNVRSAMSQDALESVLQSVPESTPVSLTHLQLTNPGVYEMKFDPTLAGDFPLLTTLKGVPFLQQVRVIVRPGQPSPTHSLYEGPGISGSQAGSWAEFNVTLRDNNSNPTGISTGHDVGTTLPDVTCRDQILSRK